MLADRIPCQGCWTASSYERFWRTHPRLPPGKGISLLRDAGDIGGPDLVRCPNLLEIHLAGKLHGWLAWHGGAEILSNLISNLDLE